MRRLIEQLDAEPDPRPWQEPPGDLHETTVEVWEKIAAWSSPIDDHRFLARFGEAIVRLERSGSDGTVHDRAGYGRASRCFYAPAPHLSVPPVPEHPSVGDVEEAKRLIVEELLGDFPFVSPSELSHAVAMLLEQFVRVMIDGPTPLYLREAPTPGTGKSLLADVLTLPASGRRKVAKMAEARDPDEWRKRLVAKLRNAPAYLVDNLRRALDSGALAMTLTAGEIEDRLLGVSETVTLPVRCTLAATANNPQVSDEMARRSVRIRLDTGMEFPEQRGRFRHPDLGRPTTVAGWYGPP